MSLQMRRFGGKIKAQSCPLRGGARALQAAVGERTASIGPDFSSRKPRARIREPASLSSAASPPKRVAVLRGDLDRHVLRPAVPKSR